MRLKLPSEGESCEMLSITKFSNKDHSESKNNDRSGKQIAELSVKATLFDEGTLKNLLREKASRSQLLKSVDETEEGYDTDDDDDDFEISKKPVVFKSRRLQDKQKKDTVKDEVEVQKLSNYDKEDKLPSAQSDGDKTIANKEREEKHEIEGFLKYIMHR